MATVITCNKKFYRKGLGLPSFTATGQNGLAKWYIKDNIYLPVSGVFDWTPPNRTQFLDIAVRDLGLSSFSSHGNITNSLNNFTKSGQPEFDGVSATAIASGNCAIEGKPNIGDSALTLQSQNSNYAVRGNTLVNHALQFFSDETGAIIENGVDKEYFSYVLGDSGLVELVNGIVRYWLISPSGEMKLLRSTRSTLTYPLYPSVVLYGTGAQMNLVKIWSGVEGSLQFQSFGILKNFQDWQNPAQYESLAEKTMSKDKVEKFTYFTSEKNIKTVSVNLEWRDEDEYFNFLEFFRYHDLSREFIFADYARKKFGEPPQMSFMRFTGALKDNPIGTGLFGISVDIRDVLQSQLTLFYRQALIPPDDDLPILSDIFTADINGAESVDINWGSATDIGTGVYDYEIEIELGN